ncbi:MAG: DUF3592 domain-containing protein [bacterium]|nr:DUF3592 domain-containing protein [bacterium]
MNTTNNYSFSEFFNTPLHSTPKPHSIAFFPLFIGVGALFIGLIFLYATIYRLIKWKRATGIIRGLTKTKDLMNGSAKHPGRIYISYFCTVEFTTDHGEPIRFQSQFSAPKWFWREGSSVRVLYDPKKPKDAEVANFLTLYFFPLIFFVFGFFLCWIALGS